MGRWNYLSWNLRQNCTWLAHGSAALRAFTGIPYHRSYAVGYEQQRSTGATTFAEGKASRDELLDAETASYHSPGTCTFYGTANSNQILMEALGLQLPGGSFVNPGTLLRDALTAEAAALIARLQLSAIIQSPLAEFRRQHIRECDSSLARFGRFDQSHHPPYRHGESCRSDY